MRDLLSLELDPLVVAHELDLVSARLGDLDEGVGARESLEKMNAAMATRVYATGSDGRVGFRLVK